MMDPTSLSGLPTLFNALSIAGLMLLTGGLYWLLTVDAGRSAPAVATDRAVARRIAGCTAFGLALALLGGLAALVASGAMMAGLGLSAALAPGILGEIVSQTRLGQLAALRLGLLLAAAACGAAAYDARYRGRRTWLAGVGLTFSLAAIASIAGGSHAAAVAGDAPTLHLLCYSVHLMAAALWLGGLPPHLLVIDAAIRQEDAAVTMAATRAVGRFGNLALICVLVLMASGSLNLLWIVGSISALTGSAYGRLLLVKLLVFGAMLVIAVANRRRLTPGRAAQSSTMTATAGVQNLVVLRRNLLVETALGLAVVIAASGLASAPPPATSPSHHSAATSLDSTTAWILGPGR